METGQNRAFLRTSDRRGLLTRLAAEEHVPVADRVTAEIEQREAGVVAPQAAHPGPRAGDRRG